MRKIIFPLAAALFALCAARMSAHTVYLYIEESCNGEHGFFLTKAREGVFDSLFNAGHIVFDDSSDTGTGTRLVTLDVAVPLATARNGGADVLLTISIESKANKIPTGKAGERIASRCSYALFEVGSGRKLAQGERELSNLGKEAVMDRNELGRSLGHDIGKEIERALAHGGAPEVAAGNGKGR